ncbi:dihydroorotase [Hutsoniella sourekii]
MGLLLQNAKINTRANDLLACDVLIEDGHIVEMATSIEPADHQVVNLEGRLLAPGLVDIHVHFREPGFTDKETIKTGSRAAARGGFVAVGAMPNTNPVPDTVENFQAIQAIIDQDAVIDVYHYAPITHGLRSDELVDMEGINAFAYTNDGVGVQTAGVMYEAMVEAARLGKPIVAHTEDESILYGGVMHEGIRNKELGLPGIIGAVESSQIARDILLAQEAGVHYHVCHVSSKESVAMIRLGKQLGIKVTAEVTPHHLLLNEMDIPEDQAIYKMNPPLRGQADQEALIEGLLDGTIDIIATDHAPHTRQEKSGGFLDSPFGIVGIETSFAMIYTHFVQTGKMTLAFALDRMSSLPAQLFNLPIPRLEVGAEANLAAFDLERDYVIDPADYQSKSDNTPFNGETVRGMCDLTICHGEIVWNQLGGDH